MLEHQFYIRVVLNVILGVILAYSFYRMAVQKNREVVPKKHIVIKIIGGIFALLCCFWMVLFVISLRQIDFPISMNQPFIGSTTIVRTADTLLIWGQPTYIQNMALVQSTGIFISLGIAAYCFMFKSSCSKWYSKLGKFFLGVVLYTLYASSTDFHYFDFWELLPTCLFLAISIYVIFKKDKTVINVNDGTINGIKSKIEEVSSSNIVNESTDTTIEEKETTNDINVEIQDIQQIKDLNNSQKINEYNKSENNKYKWKPLLFILGSIFSLIIIFVLVLTYPENKVKSFKRGMWNEIRIGNFEANYQKGHYSEEDVKIAGMKYWKVDISERDQDEPWQHSILHKFYRFNNDNQSKFYGERIDLRIYDISSDIAKSNYTEQEYYKYLANQIKLTYTSLENVDYINNGVIISSETFDWQDGENEKFLVKFIIILINERVYEFDFSVDGYPKSEDDLDTFDKRFTSVIDRIDFSSYQQWKDVENLRPYYIIASILLVLAIFLFPLLGVVRILNNFSGNNTKADIICKAICWLIIIINTVGCIIYTIVILDEFSIDDKESFQFILCYIIVMIPLFILVCHYNAKSYLATEKSNQNKSKGLWGKVLLKIGIYPFAIIATLLYSCKEQFMKIFNNFRNKNN